MTWLFILAGVLALGAVFLLWQANRQRVESGLPMGRIVYDDSGGRKRLIERPLFEPTLGITGKPDYLVEQKGLLIPVEVKSSAAPAQPYDNHIMQLAAYCYLVEKTLHRRPTHGIIRYRNRSFEVDYTPELETQFLDLVLEIRQVEKSGEADRSHNFPARCLGCGYRSACDQRL
jgi:CRISPR-associated exonuclease Cas4